MIARFTQAIGAGICAALFLAAALPTAEANVAVLAGARTAASGSGGASLYTATHCVDDAANDMTDQGSTAYEAAAAGPGNTCPNGYVTLHTAMVHAQNGDVILAESGIYNGPSSFASRTPTFYPRANNVTLFCRVRAATNRASLASSCELRMDSPPTMGSGDGEPIIGATMTAGGDNFIVDGFWALGDHVPPWCSQGAFAGGADNVEFRGMYYDFGSIPANNQVGDEIPMSDNCAAFFMEGGAGNKIRDSYITGSYGWLASVGGIVDKNFAAVSFYSSPNFLVEYTTFYDIHSGIFVKANPGGTIFNSGTIRNNRFERGSWSAVTLYEIDPASSVQFHTNLMIDAGFFSDFTGENHGHAFSAHSNTSVGGPDYTPENDYQYAMIQVHRGRATITGDTGLYDNLIVINDAQTTHFMSAQETFGNSLMLYTLLDFNVYYDSTGTPAWLQSDGGSSVNWASYLSALSSLPTAAREANSYSDQTVTLDANYCLVDNGQTARNASSTGGPVGYCESPASPPQVGVRDNPSY